LAETFPRLFHETNYEMPLFIGQTHIEIKHARRANDRRTSQLREHGTEPSAVCRSRTNADRLADRIDKLTSKAQNERPRNSTATVLLTAPSSRRHRATQLSRR